MEQSFESPPVKPEKKEKPLHPKLREIVAEFDFSLLADLLHEYIIKTDKNPADINLIPPEKFHGNDHGMAGSYDAKRHDIGLSYDHIWALSNNLDVDTRLFALRTLIHEEIHAATDQKNDSPNLYQVGYDQVVGRTRLFGLWNEGVTETLAREILQKYIQATEPESAKEVSLLLHTLETKQSRRVPYRSEVNFVEIFISFLAKQIGLPKDVVRGGVIRGLIEGQQMDEKEFRSLAEEIFPPDFFDDLEQAGSSLTIKRITRELETKEENYQPRSTFATNSFVRSVKRAAEDYIHATNRMMPI